jgi:hypothetical protein
LTGWNFLETIERVQIMASRPVSFDTVRRIGLALPDVEESTAYAMPALKVRGQLLAALPANRSAEPNSLLVRVSIEERSELLGADPAVYYLTPHYEGYDGVLVRLSNISLEALTGLLATAHRYMTRRPTKAAKQRAGMLNRSARGNRG